MASEHEEALRAMVEAVNYGVARDVRACEPLATAIEKAEALLRPVDTVRDFGLALTPLQIDESKMRAMERTIERAVLERTEALVGFVRRFMESIEDGKPQQGTRDLAGEAQAIVLDHDLRKNRAEQAERAKPPERLPSSADQWRSIVAAYGELIHEEERNRTDVKWLWELWARQDEARQRLKLAEAQESVG